MSTSWKHRGAEKVQHQSFLTSAQNGGEWSTSRRGCFTPGQEPQFLFSTRLGERQNQSQYCGEGKGVSPLQGFEIRTVQPAGQSLYRLFSRTKFSLCPVNPQLSKLMEGGGGRRSS